MLQKSIRIAIKERSLLAHDLIQKFDRHRLHHKKSNLQMLTFRFRSDLDQTIQSTMFISRATTLVEVNQDLTATHYRSEDAQHIADGFVSDAQRAFESDTPRANRTISIGESTDMRSTTHGVHRSQVLTEWQWRTPGRR